MFLRTPGSGRSWCTAAARRSPPCSTGSASPASSRAACGSPRPEAMDVVRMVLVGQVGRELVGLINAARPARGRHVRRGRRPVHRRARRHRAVDGEEVDLGLVGDVVDGRPDGGARPRSTPAGSRWSPPSRPDADGVVHNVNADTAAAALAVALGAAKLRRAHRRRGPLRATGRTATSLIVADRRRRRWRSCCRRWSPAWCRRWRPACGAVRGGRARGRTWSTAGCRTPCCWRSSPTRASAPWCVPERADRHDRSGARRPRRPPATQLAASAAPTSLMNTFGTPPLVLVRGEGAVGLGRRRQALPRPARRHRRQRARPRPPGAGRGGDRADRHPRPRLELLRHRAAVSRWPSGCSALLGPADGRVFFTNSGAEANEAAFKLARRTGRTADRRRRGRLPRPHHGRARADRPAGQARAVRAAARRRRVRAVRRRRRAAPPRSTTTTAAVILEPIQGEAGVVVPPRRLPGRGPARSPPTHGALLVLDEVQTGIGRTGHWFAHQHAGVAPDVVTLAKGLGGGLPIGAASPSATAADLLQPGQHGTTFGGNPVCAAAALAVLDTIERGRPARPRRRGSASASPGDRGLGHPLVDQVRGRRAAARHRADRAMSAGRRRGRRARPGSSSTRRPPDVIRLAPPLILTTEQADAFVAACPRSSTPQPIAARADR